MDDNLNETDQGGSGLSWFDSFAKGAASLGGDYLKGRNKPAPQARPAVAAALPPQDNNKLYLIGGGVLVLVVLLFAFGRGK